VLNLALAAVLAVAVTFAYTSLGASASSAATRVRTGTVAKGTVVTTVSASGTLISPNDLALGFVTSGTLRKLDVKVGDRVTVGQTLAQVDDTSAKESVASATSSLAAAVASRTELLQGQTAAEKTAAAIQLQQGAAQITSAQTNVTTTQQNNAADATDQAAAVTKAQAAVTTAKAALAAATGDKVATATSSLSQASAALTTAQQQQASTKLKDEQSLVQAQEQVTSAQLAYQGTVAQQAVSSSPPTATQLTDANNAVSAAKIQLASAQRTLEGTTLKAAASGTVLSISTPVGGTVSSSSTSTATGAGTAVPSAGVAGHTATVSSGDSGFLVLTGVTGFQVSASFTESDVAQLKVGQGAAVTLNALPGAPVGASIASISSTGTTTSGVVSYTVYLDLKGQPKGLKVGQSGTVTVITKEADGVLNVPSAAVTTLGGVSTVTVMKGNTKVKTTVTIGIKGDTATVIASGLTAGETIALSSGTATTGTAGTTGTLTGGTGGGGGGFGGGPPGG
jgi:multidrug efflux pump subunit AcrA (membrane-fusion protein)